MSRHFWKTADCAPPLEQPESRVARDIFGGGGGTVNTNTVTNSDPWDKVQPYLTDVFGRAQGLANRGPYSGPYLAGQSPYTSQAIGLQAQKATAGSPLVNSAQNQASQTIGGAYLNADPGKFAGTLRGDYLSVDSNPYLQGAVQKAIDQAKMGVSKQFSGDNYGGSANQEWLGRAIADTAAPIYAQNYQQERDRMMNAGALTQQGYEQERGRQLLASSAAPQLDAAKYQDIDRLASAGAAQEARGQAEIGAAQQQFGAPWDTLTRYQQGIAGGAAAGGQSATAGQSPYFSNPLASALGLGIGGLSLYNGLGKAGLFGGGAAAGGGGLFEGAGMGDLAWLAFA